MSNAVLDARSYCLIRGVCVIEGKNSEDNRVLVLWGNRDETDNDHLDDWFEKQSYSTRDLEYDLVYLDGDSNLENLRCSDQTRKVRHIEEEFPSTRVRRTGRVRGGRGHGF